VAEQGFRQYVGLQAGPARDGRAEVRLVAGDRHLNPHGSVHGGVLATLADTAMGLAVASTGDGERPVTIEMKVTYLQPGQPGLLRAEATTRKPGRRITIVEAEVFQGDSGDVVAHAIATFTTD
jgi:uncharacterized protein (TIGR00369 family)